MSRDDKVNELIERVRFICVKGGVRPEIMGALCHAIRYDDTNAAPREITAEVSSPVLGEFGEVPQSEGTHTHPVPTREANAARGAAPVVTHSAVAPQEPGIVEWLAQIADLQERIRQHQVEGQPFVQHQHDLHALSAVKLHCAPSASAASNSDAQDAARYRHLREQDDFAYWLLDELEKCGYVELSLWQLHFDGLIDQHMAKRIVSPTDRRTA